MIASCMACDVELVADGSDRKCPRCGRLFSLALVPRGGEAVFRDAPFVDLAPLVLARPRWSRLYVRADDAGTFAAAVVSPPAASYAGLRSGLALLGPALFMTLIVEVPMLAFVVLGGTIVAGGLGSRSAPRRDTESVSLDERGLRIQMTDPAGEPFGLVTIPAQELAGVAHDEDGIRALCSDGTTVELWRGMNLPRDVRRYLAQRLAARLR